jgi:hypothetical protein
VRPLPTEGHAGLVNRAVWSFWSAPYTMHYKRTWASDEFHRLSWVLSFQTASAHFPRTALVTDTAGAHLLVDELGLTFDEVDTCLDAIPEARNQLWALGKLYAYRQQREPFVHLDSDVYLWKPLSERLLTADVLVQNPEYAPPTDQTYYHPSSFIRRVQQANGWLPPELSAYLLAGGATAFCTGIFGGTATDLIAEYADRAIAILEHPANEPVWQSGSSGDMVLVEQYYLAAFCFDCTGRLRYRPRVEYLFDSQEESFSELAASQAGFTHLIAGAKSRQDLHELVRSRVRSAYPEEFARCVKGSPGGSGKGTSRFIGFPEEPSAGFGGLPDQLHRHTR